MSVVEILAGRASGTRRSTPSGGGSVGPVTVPAAVDPTGLTWTKDAEVPVFFLIDEAFIYETNDFDSATGLTAVTGSAPSVSGGNLVISDSGLIKGDVGPTTAWWCREMTIADMAVVGTQQRLGPQLIKDGSNYLAGFYDSVNQTAGIIQNGNVLFEYTVVGGLNTTGLKLYLICSCLGLSLWAREVGGQPQLMGYAESAIDYRLNTLLSQFHFGTYSAQAGGSGTHYISQVRAGASGGSGFFNTGPVFNVDGSPRIYNGKELVLKDLGGFMTGNNGFMSCVSCLLAIDHTGAYEILGRFYFEHVGYTSANAVTKLQLQSNGGWQGTFTNCNATSVPFSSDPRFLLDYNDAFAEVIIQSADQISIDIDDSDATQYDTELFVSDSETSLLTAAGFGVARPRLYRGADVDSMDTQSNYSDGYFHEIGRRFKFNNQWWATYSVFFSLAGYPTLHIDGNYRPRVFSLPSLDLVGLIQINGTGQPQIYSSMIPGLMFFPVQSAGKTYYKAIGFNTNSYSTTDANGATVLFLWCIGDIVILTANEHSIGYEFPDAGEYPA